MGKIQLFNRFSSNLRDTLSNYSLTLKAKDLMLPKDLYLCPISLTLHSIDNLKNGDLTIEHVPPSSLGGKPLVFTDKRINNKDGYTSDKDILQFFQTKNFFEHGGQLKAKIFAESLGIKGISTQFSLQTQKDLKSDKAKIQFVTSPQNIKVMNHMGMFSNWDGLTFKVSGTMSKRLNKKVLLKCAYLTAFSRIGYELLFDKKGFKRTTYGILISVLNDQGDSDAFPLIGFDYHAPLEKSDIGIINEPAEYRTLFVNLSFKLEDQAYKYVVFLPHPDEENLDCLRRIKSIPDGQTVNFNISEIVGKI